MKILGIGKCYAPKNLLAHWSSSTRFVRRSDPATKGTTFQKELIIIGETSRCIFLINSQSPSNNQEENLQTFKKVPRRSWWAGIVGEREYRTFAAPSLKRVWISMRDFFLIHAVNVDFSIPLRNASTDKRSLKFLFRAFTRQTWSRGVFVQSETQEVISRTLLPNTLTDMMWIYYRRFVEAKDG